MYIYIPVIIFLIGFTRLLICIPAIIILGFVAYRIWKYINGEEFEDDNIEINRWFFVAGIIVILIIGYYLGWGRWTKQNYDWYKHNAILSDLIEQDWPVVYENENEKSMLSYYIGQYLVPAIAGKAARHFTSAKITVSTVPSGLFAVAVDGALAGDETIKDMYSGEITLYFRIAEIVQYFWAVIGIIIVWMNLMIFMKLKSIGAHIFEMFMMFFFSLPQYATETLIYLLYGVTCESIELANDTVMLKYIGNYVALRWVFIQIIVPWIVMLLFLNNKNNIRLYLFYMLPMILYAPLPLLGLIPVAVGHAVCLLIKEKRMRNWLKSVFGPENILTLISLGPVFVLYYYGNVFQPKPQRCSFRPIHYGDRFGIYLIFIIVNVLLFAAYLYRNERKNDLYYISFGELILLPLFCMGYYNDLLMRASVPALFIIMCMVLRFIVENFGCLRVFFKDRKRKNIMLRAALYVFLLALVYSGATIEFQRLGNRIVREDYTKTADFYSYGTMKYFANRKFENMTELQRLSEAMEKNPEMEMEQVFSEDLIYNYYSYDLEDNLFYKYVAKR